MSEEATTDPAVTTAAPAVDPAPAAAAPAAGTTLLDAAPAVADPAAPAATTAAPATDPAAAPKPAEGAPEAYADFTMPDGVKLDTGILDEFKTVAKDLKLPQEAAQKVADLGVKVAQKAAAQVTETLQRANAEWTAASQADKEFGGEKLAENLAIAAKARDAFATPALSQMLRESGLGNHPEVLRMFVRVGRAIGEDNRLVVGGAAREASPPEHSFYPSMRQGA